MRKPTLRPCWWCHRLFPSLRLDVVYCSAVCGRLARGLDEHRGPKRKEAA